MRVIGGMILALGCLAACLPAVAAEAQLGGRPFSPPEMVTAMPDSWRAMPIKRPDGADLALAIDQQLFPAIEPLVREFARSKGVKVAMQEGTCGVAAGALAEKSADITGMCCPPGPLDRLPGVRYHTVGIASVAMIVHPSNPVDAVSLAEARALFGGQARSWSDLPVGGFSPGPGSEVRAVTRLHCKPRPGHWRLLLDKENQFSATAHEVPAIRDMVAEVARRKTAIGYETLWHVADNARTGEVKALRLNGIDPADREALARGRYPVYRVMNLTTWEGPDSHPLARELVSWLVDRAPSIPPSFGIVPAADMRRHGWVFAGDEVVGEPR